MKRPIAVVITALALVFGASYAQQPIVIKFSHVVAEQTPKGKGALRFKELAEASTRGRVKIEIYPNSQLFKDGEEMQMLELGNVQMLAPSVSKFGPLGAREFEVFDLPYIFDNYKELHFFTNSEPRLDISAIVRRQSGTRERENGQIMRRSQAWGG